MRVAAIQVVLQTCLLRRGHEQAQLGAAPEDVLGLLAPSLVAQVIHLALVQAGAKVPAQCLAVVDALQQAPA